MRFITCPNHPGVIIENHPCPICGHPQVKPEDREPFAYSWMRRQLTLGEPEQLKLEVAR